MKCFTEEFWLALSVTGFLLSLVVSATDVPAAQAVSPTNATLTTRMAELLKLDPHSDASLNELARTAESLAESAERQDKAKKIEQKRIRDTIGLSNLSSAELRLYFHGLPGDLRGRDIRGLTEIRRLAHAALQSRTPLERDARMADLFEVMAALRNNHRSPVPEKVSLSTPWKILSQDWRRTVGAGKTPAINLAPHGRQRATGILPAESARGPAGKMPPARCFAELSRLDPMASSFWNRPANIAQQDLHAGFSRDRLPALADRPCRYAGPKTSFGMKPGFEIECDGRRYQIKFGEVNSEPFTARIFHALGYHVDPTDYAPLLKIRYDRRLFREFHLRQPVRMQMRPLGIPIGSIDLQRRHDPFDYVVGAVFRDGQQMSGAELKQMLFVNPRLSAPEDFPENFCADIEASLDYLIMSPVNFQPKDTPAESIGSWEFGGLGHEHRRELRGAALLAAWLQWSDSRYDNTRLRIAGAGDHVELQHFFTDLGAGMGGASGWFSLRGENPSQFAWTFTQPEIIRGPGRMTTPFRIVLYHPIVATPAFREMTVDDARWMARLIGQITEDQLHAALIASGYDAAEVTLYQEKLASRRDQLGRDLNLADEIPPLRANAPNRQLSYNPSADGPVSVMLASGEIVTARSSSQMLRRGRLTNTRP